MSAGTYCATATDFNGCTLESCFDLIAPTEIELALTSSEFNGFNIACFGDNSGSINLMISGGNPDYSVLWTGPNGFVSADEDLVNLFAGTYCAEISNAGGCSATACIELIENPGFDISLGALVYPNGFNVSCGATCDGEITASISGESAPFIYAWSGPLGFSSSESNLSGLCAGSYTLTVTDANQCSQSQALTITTPTVLNIDLESPIFNGGNEISCFGDSSGTIFSNATGGSGALTFEWSGVNGFTSDEADIVDLTAGTYSLAVTDDLGCTATDLIELNEPEGLLLASVQASVFPSGDNISCVGANDGSMDATAIGGTAPYDFDWNGPAGFISTDQNIGNLQPGAYTLVVEDANSCVFTILTAIEEPAEELTSSSIITIPILCFGANTAAIEVTASGGSGSYAISWTGPDGFTSGLFTIENLFSGSYNYTITDLNECVIQGSIFIAQPLQLNLSTQVTPATCISPTGAIDLTVANGVAPFTYIWSTGAASQDLVNIPSGNYNVTVTDANLCTAEADYTVNQISNLEINTETIVLNCNGDASGMITTTLIQGTEPITYTWIGPDGFTQSGSTIMGLEAGTYSLSATDAIGCTYDEDYEVTEPGTLNLQPLQAELYSNGFNLSGFQSNDGIIFEPDVTNGNPPYTFNWTSNNDYASATSNNQLNLTAGTYSLLVTDSKNCTASDSIVLTEPIPLEIPNGISPNGDGFNDFFTVRGLENYPQNKLLVFNRWGNQLYEASNYRNSDPWYGTNENGDELPEGTYFIVVELNGAENLKGYLEIRR